MPVCVSPAKVVGEHIDDVGRLPACFRDCCSRGSEEHYSSNRSNGERVCKGHHRCCFVRIRLGMFEESGVGSAGVGSRESGVGTRESRGERGRETCPRTASREARFKKG